MTNRPPDKEPSCINCGGAGHWAIACPEPTRKVPAGLQGQRPADERHRNGGKHGPKRHKGPIVNKYSPPAPAPTHGSHPPPFPPPYGGYRHPDPSYPRPGPAPPGHYGSSAPPPVPQPSYSPPPHLAGGPSHGAPPYGHQYGPPGSYGAPPRPSPSPAPPYGHPPGYPGGPPPTPPPPPFPPQHHSPHQYQYYQQHSQDHQSHPPPPPPPPPPPHYDYSHPQTQPYSQNPYPPPPPPPSGSANVRHSFHGQPPHSHPPPAGPPYMNHLPRVPPPHRSPTPQSSALHGHPPSLPSLPNIGGPGSLIRLLPPKPTVQVPPADRGHGRRKDRNKGRNKRRDRNPSTTPKANGESARRNEPKPASELTKGTDAKRCKEKKAAAADVTADNMGAGKAKSDTGDVDTASKLPDKPEEGEIVDEDPEWEWDEKTIFKEPQETHPADAVAGPLPSEYTEHVLLPPAWNAKCITSKFVDVDNKSDFCRPVRKTPLWGQYKHTVPFGSPRNTRAPLTTTELEELLETRRSSQNPGPRREPKVRSRKLSFPQDREGVKYPEDRARALSRGRSISPERRTPQKDRRPAIDSYRPNYERGRRGRSSSAGRRRRRSDGSPPRDQDSPGSSSPFFQLPREDKSRDSSPESDLNSLENELLGLSPKSSSEEENKKVDEKKVEETKKRPSDDAIPKSKRRRVQVDSAFGRRW